MALMHIRAGYDIVYDCVNPTPMLVMLSLRPELAPGLLTPEIMTVEPAVPVRYYLDGYGNRCGRLLAPAGPIRLTSDFTVATDDRPDPAFPEAIQHPVDELPDDAVIFLLASRYCETDSLLDEAWSRFGAVAPGWARVEAVCAFVHNHITFGYHHARPTRTAQETLADGVGVCRDYAHLAVALCRCLNIPARYVTGYLGDIREPQVPPMDFSAWFEAYLGGRWHTFDARHNRPRIGRLAMAIGRDAADTAISTNFGPVTLTRFDVVADEVVVS
jgi:transglutaminase-like putative cysteine protease